MCEAIIHQHEHGGRAHELPLAWADVQGGPIKGRAVSAEFDLDLTTDLIGDALPTSSITMSLLQVREARLCAPCNVVPAMRA